MGQHRGVLKTRKQVIDMLEKYMTAVVKSPDEKVDGYYILEHHPIMTSKPEDEWASWVEGDREFTIIIKLKK